MELMIQGGGVTYHDGVWTYIDLVIHSFEDIEKEYPQSNDLFRSFAKHKQGASNFGYVELHTDKRLFGRLSKTGASQKFYNLLEASAPLITLSNRILGDPENIHNVVIFKLSEFEKDPLQILDRIVRASNLKTKTQRATFFDKIEKLNKIFSLKPGLFGLSININALIDEWLKKRRSSID